MTKKKTRSKRKKKRSKKQTGWVRVFRLLAQSAAVLMVLHLSYLIALRWCEPPITLTQLDAAFTQPRFERKYVPLTQISPHLQWAVIAAEDQLFFQHSGFDVRSIKKALAHNSKKNSSLRGASTISQQVAKNVFLWQGRSWIRKGLESYLTLLIELFWGKQRILEVYLNVIEMGPGVFGAEAAARHYFDKSASSLSPNQAARIASCLPNPKLYSVNPPSKKVIAKSNWILKQIQWLRLNTTNRIVTR